MKLSILALLLTTGMLHSAAHTNVDGTPHVPVRYERTLRSLKHGTVFTTHDQVLRYYVAHGTLRNAQELAKKGLNGTEIYRLQQLHLPYNEYAHFTDTAKPNAVVIYTADPDNVFESKPEVRFIQQLRECYDVRFRLAATEQEVYTAIESIPDIQLIVISGHGTKESVTLSSKRGEEHKIDVNDAELLTYLAMLPPDAAIFLNACSTAEGEHDPTNLANTISRLAPGRQVIAARAPYAPLGMRVKGVYPLELQLLGDCALLPDKYPLTFPNGRWGDLQENEYIDVTYVTRRE